MSINAVLAPLLTLLVLVTALALLVGGTRGPSKLFRFIFAPGIGCIGRIIQAVITLVILGLVFVYGVSHVLAPGSIKIPFVTVIEKPKPDPHIAWHFDYPVGTADTNGRINGSGWRVSQDFLDVLNAYNTKNPNHLGEDWVCAGCAGKPVNAIAGGFVIASGANKSYGHLVIIRHPLPQGSEPPYVVSFYGHLASRGLPTVSEIKWIEKGTIVGYVGMKGENGTDKQGNPWAQHLHFELREDSSRTGKPDTDPNYGYNTNHTGFLDPTNTTSTGNTPGGGWIDQHRDFSP
jgi:murein DD-endopeptidase MepM/ murein hydrolase activator NlpD